MAEVVGVVSSAITFATVIAQVTESIMTIKDCWSQFRDAPDDLNYPMRDLELFGLILAEIEEDLSEKDIAFALKNSKHALQSLQLSREAATGLTVLSNEIMRDMHCSSHLRKSYAAAKAQCYTRRALMRVRPDLIAERLIQGKNNTSEFKSRDYSHDNLTRGETPEILNGPTERVPQGKSRYAHTAKYLWRLMGGIVKAGNGFTELSAGKVQDIQTLFALKKASPFDRTDRFGYTLLHYAMLGPRKAKVLKFLLEQGAGSSIRGIPPNLETPLDTLVFCGTLGLGKGQPLFPSLRLLLRYTRQIYYEDTPEEIVNGSLSRFRGSSEEFEFLQQQCCPSYYEMPQETRVAVACKAVFGVWDAYNMPGLFQTMLGPTTLTAQDLQLEGPWRFDSQNTTLVYCVVRKLGASQAALQGSHSWKKKWVYQSISLRVKMRDGYIHLYESWGKLFMRSLQAGVDLNHVVGRQTLLLAFLEGYFDWFRASKCLIVSPSEALQNWLSDLRSEGIDLEKFGKIEDCIWKRELVRVDFGAEDKENPSCHRLIRFSYGPSVADCLASPKEDTFMGDCWRLEEKPVETMAGEWPC
ncbi:hypothetical protein N7451_009663 [Penicillium sp. IBT 35674x]|nr:hypothetical protein N7451_009663 [Penicillium sp. IBT 35674x]